MDGPGSGDEAATSLETVPPTAGAADGGEELRLAGPPGPVACAAWIRRREDSRLLVAMGRCATAACPALAEVYGFNPTTTALSRDPLARAVIEEDNGDPRAMVVHPNGDELIFATVKGCKLFKLVIQEASIGLLSGDNPLLQSFGAQKCLAFSTDGTKFAAGGEDGHLRVFHWPSLNIVLDESEAHRSFRDMDISLDSEYLVSTSSDGSARVWNINEGTPLVNLARSADERFECCRFSRDGMQPFLFCTVAKGRKVVTTVWAISSWEKIGFKRLLGKPVSVLSTSLDGKYLALGSYDGDFCVAEVKKMEISHWSKKIHHGSPISSIEFCPTERLVISTSNQWGAIPTRLKIPAEWKEWQIWLILLGLFLASAVLFKLFYEHSDSFWNFPAGKNPAVKWNDHLPYADPQFPDDNNPFIADS